jgi:hypothetical protein
MSVQLSNSEYAQLVTERDTYKAALEMALPSLEFVREKFPRSEHDDSFDVLDFVKRILRPKAITLPRAQQPRSPKFGDPDYSASIDG